MTDDRANIFKSRLFRFILPVLLAFACYAAWKIYDIYTNTGFVSKAALSKPNDIKMGTLPPPVPSPVRASSGVPVLETKAPDTRPKEPPLAAEAPITAPSDRVQDLSNKYRLRVSGFWEGRGRRGGIIEWREGSGTLIKSYTFDELQGMGYTVMSNNFGTVATLVNGPIHFIATMWALDSNQGVLNNAQTDIVRGRQFDGSNSIYAPSQDAQSRSSKPAEPQIIEKEPETSIVHRTIKMTK